MHCVIGLKQNDCASEQRHFMLASYVGSQPRNGSRLAGFVDTGR